MGYAERPGDTERRYAAARPPRNSSLLLLGVVSGAKNFDVRSWVRRAFWLQRPWRLGVDWRFVVGTRLPRGDNDRVSLHYEAARHDDMDFVRGSEVPPRQARVAVKWWLHAATQAALHPATAPRYIGLAYDAVLVSLPRLALQLRAYGLARQALHRQPHSPRSPPPGRLLYAGSLRWAAWADGAAAGSTWRCVAASTPKPLLDARLAGDVPLPREPLRGAARRAASVSRRCSGGEGGAFLAASPELQVLSTPLLLRARGGLSHRLHAQRLEVQPNREFWDRSLTFHQTAAGRTPSQPALLAATALARAIRNVSSTSSNEGEGVAFLQLSASAAVGTFDWEADPRVYPGPRALLARGITDGVIAEAVAERFARQRPLAANVGRILCSQTSCQAWSVTNAAEAALCCDEAAGNEHVERE